MTQVLEGVRHRVIALISGGKDSCYSMLQCVAAGHEIVGLANLRPINENENELDSYMYQTIGHQAIDLYAEAMGLPLYRGTLRKGGSLNTSSVYTVTENDEVEDLYKLLKDIQEEKGGNYFTAICSGAILSDYQRVRVEHVCSRLRLVSLSYLWRRNQAELLDEMVNEGKLNSIIVKVATLGLDQSHLGISLSGIRDHLHAMHDKYGVNICGEGGEYETFTLDCPLFLKSIVIKESSVVMHSADAFAPVALLVLKSLQLHEKPELTSNAYSSQLEMLRSQNVIIKTPLNYSADVISDKKADNEIKSCEENLVRLAPILSSITCDTKENIDQIIEGFECIKDRFGWFAISNLTSCHFHPTEATKTIFEALGLILCSINASLTNDLVSVIVLVSDMSQYAEINKEYVRHFGINPPVRVCVQSDIDVPLTISVVGFKRTEERLDDVNSLEELNNERHVMHVQSVSHWAAANIGPYSQAVVIDGILHIAGLIGLVAGSMELVSGVRNQAHLSLRHLERILDAHGGKTLKNVAQIICYVTNQTFATTVMETWLDHVEKGFDNTNKDDQNTPTTNDTEISMKSHLKSILKIVAVPNLPKNALVEWQVVATQDPIIKYNTTSTKAGEDLILSVDDRGHIFFVGSTQHLNWEEKWGKEMHTVKNFLSQTFEKRQMPTQGHMQVFGRNFFITSDQRNNLGKISLPCDEKYIDILPCLIPVINFASENTSYVINGIIY